MMRWIIAAVILAGCASRPMTPEERARFDAENRALIELGTGMMQQRPPPPQQPVQCFTTYNGNQAITVCR